ncbi:MAG TPA: hypothetical protein DCO79_09505 [Spirochaeta sp.]|nr:hypothetical protein [Spirochaeta sp.]
MHSISTIMKEAYKLHTVIPSFNIPHIPIMTPVVNALKEKDAFGLIAVARLEWMKFNSKSLEVIAEEYAECGDEHVTSLHLDHIPVIDEDQLRVDYMDDIARAVGAGYKSVMIDGSRLNLRENITCVKEVVDYAYGFSIPVEAELGAVIGHESGHEMDYEELFRTGKGFTDTAEAKTFSEESGVDWLSVAVGSVHGAITGAAVNQKKVSAILNIDKLTDLDRELGIPLVLHGGSGIGLTYLKQSFGHGIAKLNIGTDIRQVFEKGATVKDGQDNVYKRMLEIVDELQIAGTASKLNG